MDRAFPPAGLKMEGYVVSVYDPFDFSYRFPITKSMFDDGVAAIRKCGRVSNRNAEKMAAECWIAMSKAKAK